MVSATVHCCALGIETDFGRVLGGFDVIPALVSLSYDGRRSAFFRKELIAALKIIDEGHVTADNMKGSWAGAMGQSQFMPTSFRRFAEDYNGDGRRDIWSTQADVFASAANYLKRSGWRNDITWGREVRLPHGIASPGQAMKLHDDKTWKPCRNGHSWVFSILMVKLADTCDQGKACSSRWGRWARLSRL